MRVLIIGIGDAFSVRHFGTSCVVEGPEGLILVDCPDSIFRALSEASAASGWEFDPLSIQDIVVTHLHGDHCNGLEALGFKQWLARRQRPAPPPRLHMGPGAAARIWERLAPAMDQGGRASLADYFTLHVVEPGRPVRVAGLELETHPTRHPVPTTALRFSNGLRSFGWSADTPWDPDLVKWLSESDLFVHETSSPPAHTELEKLEALPDAVRSRMRLSHIADDFDQRKASIQALRQGEVLTP
ncbi:MAG: MBL fold metallo-hydrolase [Phycisphaeraceae bacterium]|nr:MBL fold metallo-hydrolase [Phycisphaeraceae bacterium]